MLIPKYWKRITKSVDGLDMSKCDRHWGKGNEAYINAWGYSNQSEADALDNARSRLNETINAIQGARDDNFYYPLAAMREDIIRKIDCQDGDAVISRNRYGALVLNTNRLMFIDIDTPVIIKGEPNFLQRLFGKKFVWKDVTEQDKQGFIAEKVKAFENFAKLNRDVGFKIYKTFAGLRVMVTHKAFDACSTEAQQLFDAFGTDPLYQKLCQSQKCFRARLTPKRWRMVTKDLPPCPELKFRITQDMLESWSATDEQRLKNYDQWTKAYDKASEKYSTCELISQVGNPVISSELSSLIQLHDEYTNACRGFSLA